MVPWSFPGALIDLDLLLLFTDCLHPDDVGLRTFSYD
jgi:hypothetical protein